MKEQPQNQAIGASETTRFFCTRISSAAGAAGELCTGKRKEPDLANRNTNPGISESTDSGVMHNPQPLRARTRGMSYGDINNIPLTVIPRARAHVREDGTPRSEAALAEWRTKTFGGDFDPVREAVEDAVNAFSYRQPEIEILISDRLKHLPFRLINLSIPLKIQARYKSFPIVAKAEEAFVQVKERKRFPLRRTVFLKVTEPLRKLSLKAKIGAKWGFLGKHFGSS